ncbi:hypothetical protein EMIT0P218_10621 [Pseudomonas sp. IT-P218]
MVEKLSLLSDINDCESRCLNTEIRQVIAMNGYILLIYSARPLKAGRYSSV